MGYIVKMPKLGLEMKQGTLVTWLVSEGEDVTAGEPLAEIESEKTTAEVDAREDGVLRVAMLDEGESVEPGDPIGIVAGPDEDISALEADAGAGAAEAAEPPAGEADAPTEDAAATTETTASETASAGAGAEVKASPRARKRADEMGVDLSSVTGSGPQGAVTVDDVEAASGGAAGEAGAATGAVKASPKAKRRADEMGVDLAGIDGTGPQGSVTAEDVEQAAAGAAEGAAAGPGLTVREERPFGGMRKTIAERLGQSYREAVHVTEHREADAEALLAAADAAEQALGTDVSVPDVLLLAVSAALDDHPAFNATFEDDVHRLYEEHNVGVAVDIEAGLIAPVIRDVGSKSLADVAVERRETTQRALDGEYTMDDLRGGTFTVTNLGVLGVESFDPVINPPQVAILGVDAIQEKAVPDADGGVAFRRHLPFDLSFDHRVVDGADAARFLQTLVEHVEDPWPLLPDEAADGRETGTVAAKTEMPGRSVTARLSDGLAGTVAAGSFTVPFDEPEDVGGSSSAPSPVDLFLGSLSACLAESIRFQAVEKYDLDLRDLAVSVDATPEHGSVESIAVSVTVDADADDERIERMVQYGERGCHVAELLRDDVPFELTWERA